MQRTDTRKKVAENFNVNRQSPSAYLFPSIYYILLPLKTTEKFEDIMNEIKVVKDLINIKAFSYFQF